MTITMDVTYLKDMEGHEVIYRNGFTPAGYAGETFTVAFSHGALLVAAGYALPAEEEAFQDEGENEPESEDE